MQPMITTCSKVNVRNVHNMTKNGILHEHGVAQNKPAHLATIQFVSNNLSNIKKQFIVIKLQGGAGNPPISKVQKNCLPITMQNFGKCRTVILL